MIRLPILLLFAAFLFLHCTNENASNRQTPSEPDQPVNEDELMARLSMELRPQTDLRADQEHNTIVNYAIDKLLNVRLTASGLFIAIEKQGEGPSIEWGDQVTAHYRGQFLDGTVFDSSYKRGKPITFLVGNMIQGWNEGLQQLKQGSKAVLLIPSHLGYGEEGLQDADGNQLVPPNTILRFDIEVLEHESQ